MTRIVFMGTPEFAVPILQTLLAHYEVVAVYTRADKPVGRGNQLVNSPVKEFALAHDLALEQPRTLRNGAEQHVMKSYQPDVILVAAYGMILPKPILETPRWGCLNVHASLLPRWRGASPIPYAILHGDTESGVTLMQMDAGLDTGAILTQRGIPLAPNETADTLTGKLAALGAELVRDALPAYLEGKLTPQPQDNARATMTSLIAKEDGQIKWGKSAVFLERMTRAYQPWPSAYANYRGEQLKILRASVLEYNPPEAPGVVLQIGKDIGVATGKGVLLLHTIQLAGKRAMGADEFARGAKAFCCCTRFNSPANARWARTNLRAGSASLWALF
ncbi:methionyl-tRNA formyltransferase [Anaerolineae bacterium CFX7]|nr:methionyl-tRNA formyltransferase [Anaerolineae bacterium CFX7]